DLPPVDLVGSINYSPRPILLQKCFLAALRSSGGLQTVLFGLLRKRARLQNQLGKEARYARPFRSHPGIPLIDQTKLGSQKN
ncbi:MAG: hypothetical protein AAF125_06340, partial [Chloroflexota bacterium]